MPKFPWLRLAAIIVVVLIADQLLKTYMLSLLEDGPKHVAGPFNLTLVYNSGVAFGLAEGYAPYLVAVAILIIVFVLIRQRTRIDGFALVAIGLVIGGAMGNLIDRLFRDHGGAVVDYIDIWRWPVFNLADAAVVVGAISLAIAGARNSDEELEMDESK